MNTITAGHQELTPTKVICIGRNYVGHIRELNNDIAENMIVFLKPNSAITTTLYALLDEPLHYEGELCFLYQGGNFSAIGFGLDLTKRQLQSELKQKGLPWERAKAFDHACLFSHFVPMPENMDTVTFDLKINGKHRQSGHVNLMIYKPETILADIQTFMTLNDGDIIMTGTPEGVGVINTGDHFSARVKNAEATLVSADWTAI